MYSLNVSLSCRPSDVVSETPYEIFQVKPDPDKPNPRLGDFNVVIVALLHTRPSLEVRCTELSVHLMIRCWHCGVVVQRSVPGHQE